MRNSVQLLDLIKELDTVRDLFTDRKFQPIGKSIKREICHRYGSLLRLHSSSNNYSLDDDLKLIEEVSLFICHIKDGFVKLEA